MIDRKRQGGVYEMKLKIYAITLLAAVVLVACGGESTNVGNSPIESETQNIKELVHDYSVGKTKALQASITSQQLMVTESDGSKKVYDLSEEDFFVSIAPYINETHP